MPEQLPAVTRELPWYRRRAEIAPPSRDELLLLEGRERGNARHMARHYLRTQPEDEHTVCRMMRYLRGLGFRACPRRPSLAQEWIEDHLGLTCVYPTPMLSDTGVIYVRLAEEGDEVGHRNPMRDWNTPGIREETAWQSVQYARSVMRIIAEEADERSRSAQREYWQDAWATVAGGMEEARDAMPPDETDALLIDTLQHTRVSFPVLNCRAGKARESRRIRSDNAAAGLRATVKALEKDDFLDLEQHKPYRRALTRAADLLEDMGFPGREIG